MYKWLRNILFLFDAEKVHHFSMGILKMLCKISPVKNLIKKIYQPESLAVEAFGLQFKNPVGLAAGFDKNALYLEESETLGFGFVEIGTVTPLPQNGNDKPRLFRLPKDKALVNRMGFNNDGVKVVAERLRHWRKKNHELIIGGNIGKNKITSNEDAWKDYEICFRELFDCVDYFVINVSSPNTPGLRELQQKDSLQKIILTLQKINRQQKIAKPLLLKISPDLGPTEIDNVIDLAIETGLHGIVVANTTISRDDLQTSDDEVKLIGAGGLSGKPLSERSSMLIKYINEKTGGKIPIIGSGGIFSGEDAYAKKNAGATLLQVWTGFIYEGPAIVKNICKELKKTKWKI